MLRSAATPNPEKIHYHEASTTRTFTNGNVQSERSTHAPRPVRKISETHQPPSLVYGLDNVLWLS